MSGTPSLMRNVGHHVATKYLNDTIAQFDHGTYVANTSVSATGFMLDLLSTVGASPGTGVQPGTAFTKRPASGKIVVPVKLSVPAGGTAQTFTLRAWLKHSTASGGTYIRPSGAANPTNVQVIGPTTATGIKRYVAEFPLELDLLNRYVKLHISHNGNSTASFAKIDIGVATLTIGGADQTPVSASGRG